jgi:hypothetical protein
MAGVPFPSDDEEEQRQAEVRDRLDAVLVRDDGEPDRPDHDAGDQERGDRRQLDPLEDDREHTRDEQADTDVLNERIHGAAAGQRHRHGLERQRCHASQP